MVTIPMGRAITVTAMVMVMTLHIMLIHRTAAPIPGIMTRGAASEALITMEAASGEVMVAVTLVTTDGMPMLSERLGRRG